MHMKPLWSLFITFFFLAATTLVDAQELPPIQNFTPNNYSAENQNWGISQSKQKNIYVANNGGLLEFNGAHWKLYSSPNGSAIRSVEAIDDIVFTGCYMEFGLWKKDGYGNRVYTSISQKMTTPLIEDEEFWSIVSLGEWVLFQSKERIYSYNTLDASVKVIEAKSTKAQIFNFKGSIYFQINDKGLFKIENGEAVLVSDDQIIKQQVVSGIFSLENKMLLVTENGAFYFLEENKLEKWLAAPIDKLETVSIYSSLQLADNSIVLGTISNGIYHIATDGSLLQKMNQEKGLNNNTVLSIFEDDQHNLWLALDNGVSVVNMNSPFHEYIDKNGKLGVVYAAAVYEDVLYIGTNQGLFYKSSGVDGAFKIVENTKGQVWFLKVVDGVLFCGHNNGTYTINGVNATLISDFPGTWDIKPIPNQKNLLLQGNFKGLSVLEKKNNRWGLRNIIEGFDISSRFFEFVSSHQLVVNREFKGIYKLTLDRDFSTVLENENEAPKGTGASLVRYLDKLIYTCNNGIFDYSDVDNTFHLDTTLTKAFYATDDKPVGVFIADNTSKKLWCFTSNSINYATPGKLHADLEIYKIAIPSFVRKNFGVSGFESITTVGEEKYLIGISNGYFTIDLKKLKTREYTIYINAISQKVGNAANEQLAIDSTANLDHAQNTLFFSYHIPEFDKYTEVNYQYQLKGMYDDWSSWSSTSNVSFENLPHGDYTFNVRAKVGNNLSANVASYSFTISRPWFLSAFAFVVYFLMVVALGFGINRLYKQHYKRQQAELLKRSKRKLKRKKQKAERQIVQIKNEKLKEEVASKNRELAMSTMSIIKKNELLNTLKAQLKETSVNNAEIKTVLRTIDRNINNQDDWNVFEDAFNNADKNFLKKIKKRHQELTANDLRLCAYLRLNLSSKEIAPLLNISVRSVEVKRYRLRKKLDLPREESLTDYIMSI